MDNCVFCRIVKKELPAMVVAKTSATLTIIPKEMEVRGHLLVISKAHFTDIFEADDATLKQIMLDLRIASVLVRQRLGATGVNLMHASGKDAQQSVPHLHFHIIPRFPKDGLDTWIKKAGKGSQEKTEIHKILTK